MPGRAAVCVIGFGELGSVLAVGLVAAGVADVRVYVRRRAEADDHARALGTRILSAGAHPHNDLEPALRGVRVAISAVPAAAAGDVAERAAPLLDDGALFVDLSADLPERKAAAAEIVERQGGRYVDVAVMGTAVMSGYGVPMLASGSGAAAWGAIAGSLGMQVDEVEGRAGRASTVKLLRSVYMKGRDALMAEMLVAARRYGLDAELLPTIAGPGEEVSFPELAERVLCSLALHADRRADELDAAAELLRGAGLDPLVTAAAAERLRWISDLGLGEDFAGQRPQALEAVLEAIDARTIPSNRRMLAAWEQARTSD
jgi:3-hydroxyisobutyrate dehydrogenase-like beta-hydroxyacid dehydrogenase